MSRREVIEVRDAPMRRPRDFVVAAISIALGWGLAVVLPFWLWGFLAVAVSAIFFGLLRRNRRGPEVPPEWVPGKPPSPN